MCSLCTDGYCTESFFKAEDLKPNWISPKCPLVSEEKFIENSDIYAEATSSECIANHYDEGCSLEQE